MSYDLSETNPAYVLALFSYTVMYVLMFFAVVGDSHIGVGQQFITVVWYLLTLYAGVFALKADFDFREHKNLTIAVFFLLSLTTWLYGFVTVVFVLGVAW